MLTTFAPENVVLSAVLNINISYCDDIYEMTHCENEFQYKNAFKKTKTKVLIFVVVVNFFILTDLSPQLGAVHMLY